MVSLNRAVTLVREGYFEGDLKEELRKYSEGFIRMPNIRREKYGIYVPETPSLVIVSKMSEEYLLQGTHRINLYASFSSFSEQTNQELLEEFQRKTGIKLPFDHPNLRHIESYTSFVFQEIVKRGPKILGLEKRV